MPSESMQHKSYIFCQCQNLSPGKIKNGHTNGLCLYLCAPSLLLSPSLSFFLPSFLSLLSFIWISIPADSRVCPLSLPGSTYSYKGCVRVSVPLSPRLVEWECINIRQGEELSEAGEHTGENYITPCKLLRTSRPVGFIGTG